MSLLRRTIDRLHATRRPPRTPPAGAPHRALAGERRATWAVIGVFGGALSWVALALHPVGDYYAESDFYGGYAAGARLIQHGTLDFSRYSVVGPVHELLLAAVGWMTGDLFAAARLISVAAALVTLALWAAVVRVRGDGATAFWTVALIATNAYFFQYGYSATTEMLSLALQAACLHGLLVRRGARAPWVAGLFAALATLTRYSGAVMVPAGLASLAWLAPIPGVPRRRAIGLFLLGFALPAGVWTILSVGAGHVPGANLVRGFAFYANPSTSRNVQDAPNGFDDDTREYGLGSAGLREVLRPARLGHNAVEHLERNGRDLLGLPVGGLAAVGLVLLILDSGARGLLPALVPAALLFVALIPVFYSDRYALALVPAYAALAATVAAAPSVAFLARRLRFPLTAAVVAAAAVWSARASVTHQQQVRSQLPLEVLESGPELRRVAAPGAGVVSRKGHIGYYSGLNVIPFPRFRTLQELSSYARERHAAYLYFSWYEALMREEFAYLLDTTAVVPGLSVVHATARNPGVVYRIAPEFGRDPAWLADPVARRLHLARAMVQVLPDSLAWTHRTVLAAYALAAGDAGDALREAELAARGNPGEALCWTLQGEALRQSSRFSQARLAFGRALALDAGDTQARVGLGWAELAAGDSARAAETWRIALARTTDAGTRAAMAALFERLGDAASAAAARAEPNPPGH